MRPSNSPLHGSSSAGTRARTLCSALLPAIIVVFSVLPAARADDAGVAWGDDAGVARADDAGAAQAADAGVAGADDKGWPGEHCRARSECRQGLRCVDYRCRSIHEGDSCKTDTDCADNLMCKEARCLARFGPTATTPAAAPEEKDFLDTTRLLVGVSFGAGVTKWTADQYSNSNVPGLEEPLDLKTTKANILLGVHLGVLIHRFEISVETAPVSFWPIADRDPVLSFLFNLGYFIPLPANLYWPIRIGAGLITVNADALNTNRDDMMFQARAHVVGLAYRIDRIMLELDVPGVRWMADFDKTNLVSIVFALRALYLF